VLKKLEAQRTLWKEREEQINTKRIMQAIEIERERREFEKIVREQEAAFDKEKKELEQKQQKALIHRSEILEQVCIVHFYIFCKNCLTRENTFRYRIYHIEYIIFTIYLRYILYMHICIRFNTVGKCKRTRTHYRATEDV